MRRVRAHLLSVESFEKLVLCEARVEVSTPATVLAHWQAAAAEAKGGFHY